MTDKPQGEETAAGRQENTAVETDATSRIGMWGATSSGKTTYLAALRQVLRPTRALTVGPVTERIIIDPHAQEFAPFTSAHLPIGRFLKDLLERRPTANVRVVLTGSEVVAPIQAHMTLESCQEIVRYLLDQYDKAPDMAVSVGQSFLRISSGGLVAFVVEIDESASRFAPSALPLPVTVYLSDETAHEPVEASIENLLATVGLQIESRDEVVLGSWFRRMQAGAQEIVQSPGGREAVLTAVHAADARFMLHQDAQTTSLLLQNLAPVITALQPTKDAVLRVGALLVVKIDWTVQIFQLSAAQQAVLDHQSQLALQPHEIIKALQLPTSTPDPEESFSAPEDLPEP
jgi:energy-coupling factor transporter ATP-binding protein EcfA2